MSIEGGRGPQFEAEPKKQDTELRRRANGYSATMESYNQFKKEAEKKGKDVDEYIVELNRHWRYLPEIAKQPKEIFERWDREWETVAKKMDETYEGFSEIRIHVEAWLPFVQAAFGDPENVRGKRILDLGCGSMSKDFAMGDGGSADPNRVNRMWEPWKARFLHEMGAEVVGIDIGDLSEEKFEHYQLDLSEDGVLDRFPDKSFDGVQMRQFLNSPFLEGSLSASRIADLKEKLKDQIKRLLKDDGKEIVVDTKFD